MADVIGFEILWITVDPEAETYSLHGPKKLADMCAEKLVSDVSLISQHCQRLPKSIHSLILSTAITQKRTLSIEQLMKSSPMETLELPVPDVLKSVHSIPKIQNPEINKELKDFSRISITMLSVFFDLIRKNNTHSELQTLNLGLVPLCRAALNIIKEFLMEIGKKVCSLARKYTLRCAVAMENSKDLHVLSICIEAAISLGFNFDVTGVYYYNNYFPDVQAVRMLDCLSRSNLQLMGFSFANLVPRFDSFLNGLHYFRLVKYFNLSYVSDLLSTENSARMLAATLTELPNLQRLVLKSINLTDRLTMLFLECCKKNHSDVTVPNCCLVHRGSLHHLVISSCRLSDRDLEFLREVALTDSLKYLDISDNSLHERRTFEILLSLKSSLRALNVSCCFRQQIDYDNVVVPLSSFTELKYLNIKGLSVTETSVHLLEHELQKMLNLEIIETSASLSLNTLTVN